MNENNMIPDPRRLQHLYLALFWSASPVFAAERGLRPDDVYRFQVPNDPHLSPDGERVAFVLGTVDSQKKRHSTIWTVMTDGRGPATAFTTSRENASSPRFHPDGRSLAFLSARPSDEGGAADKNQVYLLPFDGGEARRVTSLPNGVTSFVWSPDGKRLACLGKTEPAPDRDIPFERSDSRRYKVIDYKLDGAGWFGGMYP